MAASKCDASSKTNAITLYYFFCLFLFSQTSSVSVIYFFPVQFATNNNNHNNQYSSSVCLGIYLSGRLFAWIDFFDFYFDVRVIHMDSPRWKGKSFWAERCFRTSLCNIRRISTSSVVSLFLSAWKPFLLCVGLSYVVQIFFLYFFCRLLLNDVHCRSLRQCLNDIFRNSWNQELGLSRSRNNWLGKIGKSNGKHCLSSSICLQLRSLNFIETYFKKFE